MIFYVTVTAVACEEAVENNKRKFALCRKAYQEIQSILSTDWAQRALGVRKIKCPDCNGEGSLCAETKRPWSECDCGWCERGTKQRIECPRCGGKTSIPDPALSAHAQSSDSSASAEGSAKS
jgi:hypothetical protein